MLNWSPKQLAIFEAMATTSDSRVVNAVAGGAKTSTMVESINRYGGPAKAVAFNKRNAEELKRRFTENPKAEASTMNSAGHRAWGKAIGKRLTLDTDKIYNLVKEADPGDFFMDVLSLVRAARVSGIVPEAFPVRGPLRDSLNDWEELANFYDLEFNQEILAISRNILTTSIKMAFNGVIDFDDQIYMSALFSGRFEKSPLVIVDEAQDLSLLQHLMLKKMVGERIYIVGDPHQAIYGFRGAHAKSMGLLASTFNAIEMPLSVSYRCPQAVVAEAKRYVPHIEASSTAPIGEVSTHRRLDLANIPTGAHILCRYNAPIFGLAWKLIKSGRPATILGSDIGQGLIKLIRKIAPQSIPMKEFLGRLRAWAEVEIQKKPQREAIIRDREVSLVSISEAVHTSGELIQLIEKMFSGTGVISLSSIHKAKGMEWKNVVFYLPQLLPSQYATTDWQLEQENNLAYVAITRAQERLMYVEEIR